MPTEISGSTGVNKIQDGTITSADISTNNSSWYLEGPTQTGSQSWPPNKLSITAPTGNYYAGSGITVTAGSSGYIKVSEAGLYLITALIMNDFSTVANNYTTFNEVVGQLYREGGTYSGTHDTMYKMSGTGGTRSNVNSQVHNTGTIILNLNAGDNLWLGSYTETASGTTTKLIHFSGALLR